MDIKCINLSLGYNNKAVIINLETQFPTNKINVIMGSSGSGKSTLLRAIASLDDPLHGTIYYNNKPHYDLNPHQIRYQIGIIFQKPTLFEGTVYDNLVFGLKQQKKKVDCNKIESILMQLDIPRNYLNKQSNELSVGEQQRICIVRSLLPSPEVILLDEPTSALDSQTSKKVLSLIKKLNSDFNKSVIMVSHNMDESFQIADNIYFLARGRFHFTGSVEKFKDSNLFLKQE